MSRETDALLVQAILTLFTKMERLMTAFDDLQARLDQFQTDLDGKQAAIKTTLDAHAVLIADLQKQLAEGMTPAQVQATIDRIAAMDTDLLGTITG